MRRAAKIDSTQPAIVQALRATGCHVQSLAAVGEGCPDLLVSRGGRWFVLECKDGDQPTSKQKLTPDQVAWHAAAKAPVAVVRSVDEALYAVRY